MCTLVKEIFAIFQKVDYLKIFNFSSLQTLMSNVSQFSVCFSDSVCNLNLLSNLAKIEISQFE